MNRANVIGPSRRISSRMRSASGSSCPTDARSGGGTRRRPGSGPCQVHVRPMMSRGPGPTSVCPPRRIGIGAADGGGRQGVQPRVRDPVGEQQVRREPVLRVRPERLVRAESMGEEDARVDDGGVAQPGHVVAERLGAVPVEERAQDGRGRSSVRRRRRRACPAPRSRARVRDAVWRSSQARVAEEVRPAMSSSARRSSATCRTAASRLAEWRRVDRPRARRVRR